MKNEKGITLTSLVIMIIVLIILASIVTYSGIGIIRYTNYNKAKAEMQTIQSNVNKWKEEYLNGNNDVLEYGDDLEDISSEITQKVDDTFTNARIIEQTEKDKYKFFSEDYLKNDLGLNASFDYLVNIINRNVLLVGGVLYNSKTYYTLEDFGLINVEENLPNSISFDLEQGDNTDVIISDLKLLDSDSKESDISKFIVEYTKSNENDWKDITTNIVKFEDGEENNKTTKYKFSVKEFGEYEVRVRTTDKKFGDIKDITLKARPGIYVGDYITYTSPTASVTFSDADTGYSTYATTPAILTAKDTFRVMEINDDGSMLLMGAMTLSDTSVNFSGAKGYNNAVYTLNAKCSELYKDTSKGITARSIKVEDITDKFNQTGKDKLTNYISTQISSLSPDTDVTKDTTNNTVTYSNGNTNYPDIFQYEAGGLIDSTATSGVIGQSESYSGYGGLTDLANKKATISLTVPYTYSFTSHVKGDFKDSANSEVYQNMFFGTGTSYWFASRSIKCNLEQATFYVCCLINNGLGASDLCYSNSSGSYIRSARVCPVVYLPSSVEVIVSTDDSTYHQSEPHVVK